MTSFTNDQLRFGKIEITRAARPEGMGRAPQGATTDPRQAVREALDEEMRSRPTTVWQAFWEGFKRA